MLLVDDEGPIRTAFARQARAEGLQVDLAASAGEALARAQRTRYPVVVTDLKMPEIDGLTMIQRWKELQPDTVFIAITGCRDTGMAEEVGAEPAVVALLPKPWDQTLFRAIRQLLDTGRSSLTATLPPAPGEALDLLVVGELDEIERLLAREGTCQVRHARGGSELVSQVKSGAPNAILLPLPANGDDSLQALQALDPDVAVIAVHEGNVERDALRALSAGAQDCLSLGELDPTTLYRSIRFSIERKQAERRRLHSATRDPLTELLNRSLLVERMQRAVLRSLRTRGRFALMLLDIDRFKSVNIGLGHDAGDALLREVARRLEAVVHPGDTVARFGADEFALLIESYRNSGELQTFADQVLLALNEPIQLYDTQLTPSACLGMALFPEAGRTVDSLIKAADIALNDAKMRGPNVAQIYGSMTGQAARERTQLESLMRRAVKQEEFEFHFQPQIALGSGSVVGAEALLRWQPGSGQPVSPARCIPILEDTGLIVPVGMLALRRACRQLHSWRRQGHDINLVSVNVSPRQLEEADFAGSVRSVLDETQLKPGQLELEITEGLLMRDTDRTCKILTELSEMGVRIAIDDFGTGYSSLAYLHRFPVHTLKIDRSFIKNLGQDPQCESIAGSIIVLAHRLKLSVVAEGVETREQCEFLAREGCEMAQGYFFAKPCPAQELFKSEIPPFVVPPRVGLRAAGPDRGRPGRKQGLWGAFGLGRSQPTDPPPRET